MFSLAYVVLPFSDLAPGDAIRNSLARFRRGLRGDVPDEWLAFEDETAAVQDAHEARFTFTDKGTNGFQIAGGNHWYVDTDRVQAEMRLHGRQSWTVRFADLMDLPTFFDRFVRTLERNPDTGACGFWRNPLGRWDWWDLGGRFDGSITGERNRTEQHRTAAISSGESRGRAFLDNMVDAFREALDQAPVETVDIRSDRNIELASTLLADARAGRRHAFPGALVLPPGVVTDHSRWLGTWPELGPVRAFGFLGLEAGATWEMVVEAAFARFHDHWVAGVAYHH